ncbi:MAG: MopE-related protein [Pseudomonadota bacterium]
MRPHLLILTLGLALAGCPRDDSKPADDTGPDTTPDDTDTHGDYPDEDRDGHTSDVDCDDHNYQVYPDAPELCDSLDNDCDSEVDEDFDADGDAHFDADACDYGDDCDDGDAATYPGATEVPYDGLDQDCDGADVTDADGDGFIAVEAGGNDCDDENADVHPGATEIPFDGLDNDCRDGDSADADGDGYHDVAYGGTDCDDADPLIHPDAWDWWNDGVDQDCSGDDAGDYLALDDAAITVDGTYTASGTSYYMDLLGYGLDSCDFDEDGLADLVIGAPFADTYKGQVGIFYGSGADLWTGEMLMDDADTIVSGTGYDFIGFNVACGDIDGDGHQDLVMDRGEIDYSTFQTDFGILIYYGTGAAFSSSLTDNRADSELTLSMGVPSGEPTVYSNTWEVGDLDGDGADEVVIDWGSDKSFAEADLLVLPGGRYSGGLSMEDYVTQWGHGTQRYSYARVRILADIDGDGLLDLFAAEPYYSETHPDTGDSGAVEDTGWSTEGQAMLVSDLAGMSDNDLATAAYAVIRGLEPHALFGWDGVLGDFDGDGSHDAAIAAVVESGGADEGGGLYAFFAAASLFAPGAELSTDDAGAHLYGVYDQGELGFQLAWAGDLNQDGYDDLYVSEPGGDSGLGRVYLVSGALLAGDISVEEAAMLGFSGSDPDNYFASELTAGADFDGDGLPDLAIAALGWDDTDDGDIHAGRVVIYLTGAWGD